jgi:peroxiredoxin
MVAKNYIKWALTGIVILIISVFGLRSAGNLLIREITQDVVIEQEEEKHFGINIGEKAPHWELEDINGNFFKLSDFLDKPMVLTFWTTWNQLSSDQIKIFDNYLLENERQLFQIITISNQEDKSLIKNFIQRGNYQVRALLDETGQIGELYRIRTLPVTYFLDKEGVVKDVFNGVLSGETLDEKTQSIVR